MTTHTIDVYVTVTHKYIATVDSEASLEEVKHASPFFSSLFYLYRYLYFPRDNSMLRSPCYLFFVLQ